jgi:hypothetical protein
MIGEDLPDQILVYQFKCAASFDRLSDELRQIRSLRVGDSVGRGLENDHAGAGRGGGHGDVGSRAERKHQAEAAGDG